MHQDLGLGIYGHRQKGVEILDTFGNISNSLEALQVIIRKVIRLPLESREINMLKSGSIAEASLALTKVFEEAQKAADIYLENVKRKAADDPAASLYNRGAGFDEK